jgi:2-iminobutanoate/2-iminopropanoate deaminase
MAKTRLQPSHLEDPVRYSRGWKVGNTVYLAGALGNNADGSLTPEIGIQTRNSIQTLAAVLKEAGGTLQDIVKMTVFITDMRNRDGYSMVRQEFFPKDAPASTLVQVVALAQPGALIEIEAIAELGS